MLLILFVKRLKHGCFYKMQNLISNTKMRNTLIEVLNFILVPHTFAG